MNRPHEATPVNREGPAVTVSDDDFLLALQCWQSSPKDPRYEALHAEHWIREEATVLGYARAHQGVLSPTVLTSLQSACTELSTNRSFAIDRTWKLLDRISIDFGFSGQFLHVTQAVLSGVLAAHYLAHWNPESKEHLSPEATTALADCLCHYHAAWDLYTPPVVNVTSHPAGHVDPDRATHFLDTFSNSFVGQTREWWTHSNWLLVRRLLAWLIGDEDRPPVGKLNCVQMLLAGDDGYGRTSGLTAPVTTAGYVEGFPSAYLDPIALGITLLDKEMLDSLRIAARIGRPLLEGHRLPRPSLRISPQPAAVGLLLLKGGSAGGLVTVATCATAEGHRLNRDCTASFTVQVDNPALLEDVRHRLTQSDVSFGPVDPESIETKLTSEHFARERLTTTFLHHTQASGTTGQTSPWDKWVPRVEQAHQIHLRPIGNDQKLADIIHAMTGDELIERELTRHADAVFAEWQAIEQATTQSPHTQQDEQDEHRFDCYVWPGYHIEKPEAEHERTERLQKNSEPPSGRVRGRREERIHNLLRRLVRKGKFLVVYDKAGAGKTVFSWRVRTEAASIAMRQDLFEGLAPLIVRCDGTWPVDPKSRQLLSLSERLEWELAPTLADEAQRREVVRYALERRRVILIVDGFDQFRYTERQHVVDLLRKDQTARNQCHWIITSRVHTIDALRHTLFVDKDWTRVRIDPFTEKQQDRYFAQLGDRWLETVPDREALADLLQLPLVLRMIRRLIEETPPGTPLPVFRTLSELFVKSSHMLLDRAIQTSQKELEAAGLTKGALQPPEQMQLLEQVLATLAFQMMLDRNFNAILDDGIEKAIPQLQLNAEERFCYDLNMALLSDRLLPSRRNHLQRELDQRQASWRWAIDVLKEIELNHRSVTEAYRPERIAFRSRKIMECYAARYLVQYANAEDHAALRPFIGDEEWDECWRLATHMPAAVLHPAVATATFQLLFAAPEKFPRPTEHLFHAWQVMKRDPERFPGLTEILASYRQQFLGILWGPDEDRAERAAELITPEDFDKYLACRSTPPSSSCSPLPPGEGLGVRAAPPTSSILNPAWLQRVRQMYAERPTYAVCSDAKKPEEFRQTADAATRARQYTDPAHLTFLMGASPDDTSAHDAEKYDKTRKETWWKELRIAAFQMATCCVTRAQYRLFDPHREQDKLLGDYGINERSPDEDCPITHVDWWDAFCFALWLGEKYQLPNELQWEGAAWGGIDRDNHREVVVSVPPYHAGFTSNEVNHDGKHPIERQQPSDYAQRTLPVRWDETRRKEPLQAPVPKSKPSAYQANGFGLWQVNGNVWEWCLSGWADGTLKGAIERASQDIAREDVNAGTGRVVRGGSWDGIARFTRPSYRGRYFAVIRYINMGFRLSRTF